MCYDEQQLTQRCHDVCRSGETSSGLFVLGLEIGGECAHTVASPTTDLSTPEEGATLAKRLIPAVFLLVLVCVASSPPKEEESCR
jgi:hypothetical protein